MKKQSQNMKKQKQYNNNHKKKKYYYYCILIILFLLAISINIYLHSKSYDDFMTYSSHHQDKLTYLLQSGGNVDNNSNILMLAQQMIGHINNSNNSNKLKLPRVLAIVFPQYHQDPLNDHLWGNGFTDWNNLLSSSRINRFGYPIPYPLNESNGGLGYYNYNNQTIRHKQGDIAKKYNIDGFVYHHYWFYDPNIPGPTLAQPLIHMLNDGYPNISFFINWVNGNWGKTWTGINVTKNLSLSNHDILQSQTFPESNHISVREHYIWLKQFFIHPNYIKVRNQPVLMLYQKKPKVFPIIQQFRKWAIEDGLNGLYIMVGMSKTHDELFPNGMNEGQRFNVFPKNTVNRTVSYPFPYNITSQKVMKIPSWCLQQPQKNKKDNNNTSSSTTRRKPIGHQIPGIITSFDNTPRRTIETAFLWSIDNNTTPNDIIQRFYNNIFATIYYETCCVTYDNDNQEDDERFILINSMNEWAEGMSLEPSNVYGNQLLQAIYRAKSMVLNSQCLL